MSRLFEEAAELMRTGLVYLVDAKTGKYREFPSDAYIIVDSLVNSGRFIPQMSLRSAMKLSQEISARNQKRN